MNKEILFGILVSALIGYLIGCINPAFIISKLKGFDIRNTGSGNAGATNAALAMGKNVGMMIAVFDVAKACAAVYLANKALPEFNLSTEISGTACIIGHMYPFYMKFKGGKGLACLAGIILSYHPVALLILFFAELVPALLVGYGVIFPLLTSVLVPLLYGLITKNVTGALIYCIASVFVVIKHIPNIKKVMSGEELPINALWKGKEFRK
ncbi:MAG: glycerol-3-phosphate acyltransferase [Clostridia bacterium]|nr:glycerol-3-phosphate acyltransferase [Clostridia bacterium]